MRRRSQREWEMQRQGILSRFPVADKELAEEWAWTIEHQAYFGSGEPTLQDALRLFALEETETAERALDFALKCLEKAQQVDDCSIYGKWYERVREITIEGEPFTQYAYLDAATDGAEPWHDKDLGRALRTRRLFTCRWLKYGVREDALLKEMVVRLRNWLDFQYALPPDSPEAKRTYDTTRHHLPEFIQWCVEAGEFALVKDYYPGPAQRPLTSPSGHWRFTRRIDEVLYLWALHRSEEISSTSIFPEAIDRCYYYVCKEIGKEWGDYLLNPDTLGLAYLRAQMLGLPTEPRELLRRIRDDS